MTFTINSQAVIINKYTDRKSGPFVVLSVSKSGNKVVIARPDFATGQEAFNFKPTYNQHSNDYSGILIAV